MSLTSLGNGILQDRYRLIRLIKEGGTGSVYLAHDEQLDCQCAIKILSANKLNLQGIRTKEIIKMCENEAKILVSLKNPHLPRVFGYFEKDDNYYLVMDFIEGDDLTKIIAKGKTEERLVGQWALQIIEVLEYLHQNNIFYLDLKSGNVILQPNGELCLVDFGFALRLIPKETNDPVGAQTTRLLWGTKGYCSPEYYSGICDVLCDIYSLGVLMNTLMTGQEPASLFVLPPLDSDSEINKIIRRAACLDYTKRYSNLVEMRIALENFLTGEKLESLPPVKNRAVGDSMGPCLATLPDLFNWLSDPQLPHLAKFIKKKEKMITEILKFTNTGYWKEPISMMEELKNMIPNKFYFFFPDARYNNERNGININDDKSVLVEYIFGRVLIEEWLGHLKHAEKYLLMINKEVPEFTPAYIALQRIKIKRKK